MLELHIAAKLLGHADLNTTRGYVAVYEEEVVRQFQVYLGRRRAHQPSHEYREPLAAGWAEFEQQFRRRRMALGDCFRPYGTDFPHEHACIRCLHLPPYSPQLNPAENVRQFLRQNYLAHRVLETCDEIVAACCHAWNALACARSDQLNRFPIWGKGHW